MNIAIFSDAFYPQINGIVTSIISIARNMADRGHRVIIVAPSYRNLQEYSYPGVKLFRVHSISASFYDDFKWTNPFDYSVYKRLRDEDVDIVHFMTPFFISLLGIKFARKMGMPVVGTFHTFLADPLYMKHLFDGPVKVSDKVVWTYLNCYYDCADYVTAPTEEAVKIIEANGCTAPLEAISNGIDFNQFDNSRPDEFRARYGLGDKVVLYVGRVAYEKNIFTLLDAFDKAWASDRELQLLLIGDGPQREEFENYAAQLASASAIIFTGAVAHKELIGSGIFKTASLFATASRTETQGITVLEAQANGLPVVAVREGGGVNLVKDGYNGFLVEPDDSSAMAGKILYIIENRQDLVWMEKNTRKMVDIHRIDRIIDRWEALYTELIEGAGEAGEKDYLHFSTLLRFTRKFRLDFRYIFRRINPMHLGAGAQQRYARAFRRGERQRYIPVRISGVQERYARVFRRRLRRREIPMMNLKRRSLMRRRSR